MLNLIKDNDFRIRKHASQSLPVFIKKLSNYKIAPYQHPLQGFAQENIFDVISIPMNVNRVADTKLELMLAKMLYKLSNTLLNIEDKNQLVFYLKRTSFLKN